MRNEEPKPKKYYKVSYEKRNEDNRIKTSLYTEDIDFLVNQIKESGEIVYNLDISETTLEIYEAIIKIYEFNRELEDK